MPPLQLLLMPQSILQVEEEAFWCGRDVVTGEELEMGPPHLSIQLEKAG